MSANHVVADFGGTPEGTRNAVFAASILSGYDIIQTCYANRPNPAISYLRTRSGLLPAGYVEGEDCIAISLESMSISQDQSGWSAVTGNDISIPARSEEEAKAVLAILNKYRPTHACFVDRSKYGLQYLRR